MGACRFARMFAPTPDSSRTEPLPERHRPWSKRALIRAVVVVVALWLVVAALVNLVTTQMWFESVHQGSVYSTILGAQIPLFCVFALLAGLVGALIIRTVRRAQPRLEVTEKDQPARWWFRKHEARLWWVVLVLAIAVPAIKVGSYAAGQWQTYLLWSNATPWHQTDPLFNKDLSFFIEVLPFYRLVLALLIQTVTLGLWVAAVGGYFFGGFRLRGGTGERITRPMVRLVSVLLACRLVLAAVGYWLGRYAVVTSQRGPVTGASYTSEHAVLPGKVLLMVVALLAAGLLVRNAVRGGRVRTIAVALGLMVAGLGLIGWGLPALVYQFGEKPSIATVDLDEIAHNQEATLAAFGLRGAVRTVGLDPAGTPLDSEALQEQATRTAQIQVTDPDTMSPTFNVLEELQAYYKFKAPLDTDHYALGGGSRDVAVAVRGLRYSGIPSQTWENQHLVYTHGYGLVAAPTTELDSKTGGPRFLNGGMPPSQEIPVAEPRVYFGQNFKASSDGSSPTYAIVGEPPGSQRQLEFDHPGKSGKGAAAHTTYSGGGGVPIGSTLRRLLFAYKLGSLNILTSAEVNSGSRLLWVRNARARVAKVAPWLTADGDVYPTVVGGRITWVVDCFTTASTYPYSQLVTLQQAGRPSGRRVNYMRNSVKAVVDAYTGEVTLYEWHMNQAPDHLLEVWERVFPGLVKPQSSIPPPLLSHLRYPRDLFNVQRGLLARYHVASAPDFYSGNDFWKIPNDGSGAAMPPRYMSMSATGFGDQRYLLSSPMVTLDRRDLSAFMSVVSEPGPDYGRFTVLDFRGGAGGQAPAQVRNQIESSTDVSKALTLQRGGNSKVVLGGLQAIPLAGRMLWVQPVYTQVKSKNSFPVLRHIIAVYGDGHPAFADNLEDALRQAIASGAGE